MQLLIHHEGKQLGPLSVAAVDEMVRNGAFPDSVAVWHEGAADWVPFKEFLARHQPTSASADPVPTTAEENSDATETRPEPGIGRLLSAALTGLLAAALSGAAWLGLALAFKVQAGALALVAGGFTGWAVSRAGRTRETPIQMLAAFWSLIGFALGKIGIFWKLGVSPFALLKTSKISRVN